MLRTSEYWLMALRKTFIWTRFITIQSAGKMFPIRSLNMWNVSIRKSWRKIKLSTVLLLKEDPGARNQAGTLTMMSCLVLKVLMW